MFKITPSGWKKITKLISSSDINYKSLDITSLLSLITKEYSYLVKIEDYRDEWYEIDTLKDFNLLKNCKNE